MKAPIVTCGIYLYDANAKKIVVCHPTQASWNNWSIPKGLPDENEVLYTAAVRELYEETGIRLERIHIKTVHTLESKKYQKQNKILESFLVVTDTDLSTHPFVCSSKTEKGFPEVDKWKWVTLSEAIKMVHETQQRNIAGIEAFLHSNA